jgi:peptidoglycan/LPS O-acetylase OafA/YrhL
MGSYRLILAGAVVYGHVRGALLGHNPGTIAVISFFLLSGFVMTALVRKYYRSLTAVPAFYLDRFIRLAPQYYLYSILTLAAVVVFGLRHKWLHAPPTAVSTIGQLLLFPLNFYRLFPDMLLPQTWSLGLEAIFYAVFPLILICRIRLVVAIISFVVYVAAYGGVIDTDLYGYRYLPGTLFIFLTGSYLEYSATRLERWVPMVFFGAAAFLLVLAFLSPRFGTPPNQDVLLGLVIGIVMVAVLKRVDRPSAANELAGNLSYGIFLNHNLIYASLGLITPAVDADGWAGMPEFILVCALSTLLSYATFAAIEKPLIAWRHKWRGDRVRIRPGPLSGRLGPLEAEDS